MKKKIMYIQSELKKKKLIALTFIRFHIMKAKNCVCVCLNICIHMTTMIKFNLSCKIII